MYVFAVSDVEYEKDKAVVKGVGAGAPQSDGLVLEYPYAKDTGICSVHVFSVSEDGMTVKADRDIHTGALIRTHSCNKELKKEAYRRMVASLIDRGGIALQKSMMDRMEGSELIALSREAVKQASGFEKKEDYEAVKDARILTREGVGKVMNREQCLYYCVHPSTGEPALNKDGDCLVYTKAYVTRQKQKERYIKISGKGYLSLWVRNMVFLDGIEMFRINGLLANADLFFKRDEGKRPYGNPQLTRSLLLLTQHMDQETDDRAFAQVAEKMRRAVLYAPYRKTDGKKQFEYAEYDHGPRCVVFFTDMDKLKRAYPEDEAEEMIYTDLIPYGKITVNPLGSSPVMLNMEKIEAWWKGSYFKVN